MAKWIRRVEKERDCEGEEDDIKNQKGKEQRMKEDNLLRCQIWILKDSFNKGSELSSAGGVWPDQSVA